MKKSFFGVAVTAATLALSAGQASAREFADIYEQCGLGAIIAPTNPIVAVVTNVTSDLGTTAVLSNALSADTCKGGKKAKTAAYILEQYVQIEKDLAIGRGPHLNALASIAGCSAAGISELRAGLALSVANKDYSGRDPYVRAEALYDQVKRSSCQMI